MSTEENVASTDENVQTEDKSLKHISLPDVEQVIKMTPDELRDVWNKHSNYVKELLEEIDNLKKAKNQLLTDQSEMKQQLFDAAKRENVLVMKLVTKKHDLQELENQLQDYKNMLKNPTNDVTKTLLDPAVNMLFEDMKQEVQRARNRVDEMQSELSAWKFTPDSNTGKRLMAKCRLLYQENEELGKVVSSGRIAKLEGDLALQKSFSEEMKKSQAELDEFLFELDEDVEGMQCTIYYLQQQLRDAREQVQTLQNENEQLRSHQDDPQQPKSSTDQEAGEDKQEQVKADSNVNEEEEEKVTDDTQCDQIESNLESNDTDEVNSSSIGGQTQEQNVQSIESSSISSSKQEIAPETSDETEAVSSALAVETNDASSVNFTEPSSKCSLVESKSLNLLSSIGLSEDSVSKRRLNDLKPDIGGGIDSIIRKHRRLDIKSDQEH